MALRPFAFALLAAIGPVSLAAQPPSAADVARVERARRELASVAWLAGRWEGDANAVVGPTQQIVVRQSEDVVWGAQGTVLMIRGTGRSTEAATRGEIVFEAAATIWFDEETSKLRMRTHRSGHSGEPDIHVRGDTIVWGFPVPGGQVRFTIARSGEEWHEIGEFLRPGAPPFKTIEMRLKRTAVP